ncbi:FUSC family membrane protein [Formosa sp. A9]|uniref:FUSC family protein n=1 Tax=Formosa sp. A9 TaxID=3442641 RepID=UPI003EC0EFEB
MVNDYLLALKLFFKSSSFQRGLILTIGALIPLFLFSYLNIFHLAPSIAVGVLLNAPSDIPGSLKRKIIGTLCSIVITMFATTVILFSKPFLLILITVISLLSFCISLISAYGFRGSLISFSGLLAIALALAIQKETATDIWIHVGLIGIGGLWYILVSLCFYWIAPKTDDDQLLSDLLTLTGDYLITRANLFNKTIAHDELQKDLFQLQTQISDKQETLREILLAERKRSGRSHFDEKRVLIFIALVDIFELALANSLDYNKINTLFKANTDYLAPFKNLNLVMGNHLKTLSKVIITKEKVPSKDELLKALALASDGITKYVDAIGLPKAREGAMMLHNLYDYQEQLLEEIRSIRRALANVKDNSKLLPKSKDAAQFITQEEYSLSILFQNLSLKSPIFRHTLRLTIAVLLAFIIGEFFNIKNAYWIILTLIVIMRPNYGLTKERTINRIVGTLIGAGIAIGIIALTQNVVVYSILAAVSLLLAFSFIQQNYRIGALFITVNIIFVYALLYPDTLSVIKFRVVDTVIGAALALGTTYFIWPNWEFKNLNQTIKSVIDKNTTYLLATQNLYHTKTVTEIEYKIPRKEAFLAMSNLNAAFQRMTQDPKSKQKELTLIYKIVTLNNTMLAAIASMGSFIKNHKTTPPSKQFNDFIKYIQQNLEACSAILNESPAYNANKPDIVAAQTKLLHSYNTLSEARNKEIETGKIDIHPETLNHLQEAHLIYNQLTWLKTLSDNLKKATQQYAVIFYLKQNEL